MTTQEQATPRAGGCRAGRGRALRSRRDRGSLAAALDRKRAVPRPRPPRGSRELLPPHDAALYLRRSPHRALVRGGALGHDGALPPDARLQRAVPDGLRCLRAARGERRDRARDSPQGLDGRQHRADARPAPAHGRDVRLGPASSTPARRTTTAGRSGGSSSSTSRAWPTARGPRSTGARRATRCSRTSRSWTGAASARATSWSSARWSSGSSASRSTRTSCSTTRNWRGRTTLS